jgi:hypothetical protein
MNLNRRFEDLWVDAANDGASCPVGVSTSMLGAELDQVTEAWFLERTQRIEGLLVLDQARRLLTKLLAEGQVSTRTRKKASSVCRAIKKLQSEGR